MKKNGHRRWTLAFSQEIAFERHARAMSPPARTGLLGWIRRFRRRPARTFWEIDPRTGDWRLL